MIDIRNISYSFDGFDVLKDISFNIKNGEKVGIVGPSGCGKTTFLKILSGILSQNNGEILKDTKNIAFIFQDNRLLENLTVYENIKIVLKDENAEKINDIIKKVGLYGFENFLVKNLSGGMKKRVNIARAFYYNPDLLLADEPFSGLDYPLREDIKEVLKKLLEEKNINFLFVTHEIDQAIEICDKIVVFSKRPSSILKTFNLNNIDFKDNLREEILSFMR